MPGLQKNPLRAFTDDEQLRLEQLARSHQTVAVVVARAKTLLAVNQGLPFTQAALTAGRTSGQGVSRLVARFNQHGLAALETRPSGRPPLSAPRGRHELAAGPDVVRDRHGQAPAESRRRGGHRS